MALIGITLSMVLVFAGVNCSKDQCDVLGNRKYVFAFRQGLGLVSHRWCDGNKMRYIPKVCNIASYTECKCDNKIVFREVEYWKNHRDVTGWLLCTDGKNYNEVACQQLEKDDNSCWSKETVRATLPSDERAQARTKTCPELLLSLTKAQKASLKNTSPCEFDQFMKNK